MVDNKKISFKDGKTETRERALGGKTESQEKIPNDYNKRGKTESSEKVKLPDSPIPAEEKK